MKRFLCCVVTIVVAGTSVRVDGAPKGNPFNPPVVHRGYQPNSALWKSQGQIGRRRANTPLFDEADRRSFKALHLFLLDEAPAANGRATRGKSQKQRAKRTNQLRKM